MSKWKKALGLLLACAMLVTCFTACSSTPAPAEDGSTGDGGTTNGDTVSSNKDYDLYIFQFKVEIQEQLEEAVAAFEKENNIKIRLENAGGGVSYNDLLPSTMQKEDKPGLYTLINPSEAERYFDYAADLSDTAAYKNLSDPSIVDAMTIDGKVCGIPYTVEGGGVIYNKELLSKVAGADIEGVDTTSLDTIVTSMRQSFDAYKNVVEYVQAHKDEIGVKGAFSVPGKIVWNHAQHMAGAATSRAYANEKEVLDAATLSDDAAARLTDLQATYDLYINNATMSGAEINTLDYDLGVNEFAMGESVFLQQGDWAYIAIANVMENASENLGFLPIPYNNSALDGDEKAADHDRLPTGVPAYWAINSQVSEEEQQWAAKFLEYIYVEHLNDIAVNEFGFTAPYKGVEPAEDNPLAADIMMYMEEGKTIGWTHNAYPTGWSDNVLGPDIQKYTAGATTWEDLVTNAVNGWVEYKSR